MPGVGDQHNDASHENPFEEVKPRMMEYTATEIATLSSRLEKQLGPEYISTRPGAGGGKFHYLAADKCINLANEVFGFNGWSSSIQQIQVDFVDENQTTGKVTLGLSVIIRVTLRDGTYHEDVGYGHIENCKGKAPAFEKAKKEGTTDGLKRSLRNFGNLLGNCVYDKDYVAKVTKLKCAPSKWDPQNLYRHHDFAPVKTETSSMRQASQSGQPGLPAIKREVPLGREESHEDEFGSDDFDEVDLAAPEGDDPDGVTLDNSANSQHFPRRGGLLPKNTTFLNRNLPQSKNARPGSPLTRNDTTAGMKAPQTPLTNNWSTNTPAIPPNQQPQPPSFAPPPTNAHHATNAHQPPQLPSHPPAPAPPPPASHTPSLNSSSTSEHEPPVGFFTARAAETLQNAPASALKAPTFNPHLESPSIRKTAGVDHTKTKPVNRDLVSAPAVPVPAVRAGINIVNPQADKTRKLGMPGGSGSPLQNRGSYKPPQMKRPPGDPVGGQLRPVLGDVTHASVNAAAGDGSGDAKRQRIEMEGAVGIGVLNA